MPSAKCQLSSIECQLSRVQCQLSSVKHQVSSAKCQVPSVNYQVLSVNCQVSSVNYQVLSIRCPVSSAKFQVPGVNCHLSSIKCQVSGFRYQVKVQAVSLTSWLDQRSIQIRLKMTDCLFGPQISGHNHEVFVLTGWSERGVSLQNLCTQSCDGWPDRLTSRPKLTKSVALRALIPVKKVAS